MLTTIIFRESGTSEALKLKLHLDSEASVRNFLLENSLKSKLEQHLSFLLF